MEGNNLLTIALTTQCFVYTSFPHALVHNENQYTTLSVMEYNMVYGPDGDIV